MFQYKQKRLIKQGGWLNRVARCKTKKPNKQDWQQGWPESSLWAVELKMKNHELLGLRWQRSEPGS